MVRSSVEPVVEQREKMMVVSVKNANRDRLRWEAMVRFVKQVTLRRVLIWDGGRGTVTVKR